MKFCDVQYCRDGRFSIGVEAESGGYYLSIPVSNQLLDYEEYYVLTKSEFELFRSHMSKAAAFADDCRRRRMDHRLFQQPGRDRGVPT